MSPRITCILTSLALLACGLAPHPAKADSIFNVNSTLDQIDADTSDGICATAAGTCTLRAAIMQANRASGFGVVTIHVPAGVYKLVRPRTATGGELDGDLDLNAPVIGNPQIHILGSGRDTTIIDADQIDRVLSVAAQRRAIIKDLTLRNGLAVGAGGALLNAGDLTLDRVDVRDSRATGYGGGIYNATPATGNLSMTVVRVMSNRAEYGGGIASDGAITIDKSQISGSVATASGGGLYAIGRWAVIRNSLLSDNAANGGGALVVGTTTYLEHSTVRGNVASGNGGGVVVSSHALYTRNTAILFNAAKFGGGILVHSALTLPGWVPASADISNSTIVGNDASQDGGGIHVSGPVNLYNTTIAYNMSDAGAQGSPTGAGGGGVFVIGSNLAIRNTLIAKNYTADAPVPDDCRGKIGSYGRNLFGNTSGCTIATQTGSWGLLSAGSLGSLGQHGGPTETVPLLAGSNAINAGTLDGGCLNELGPITRDQRDYARVGACDIGAFEFGASGSSEIFRDGFEG